MSAMAEANGFIVIAGSVFIIGALAFLAGWCLGFDTGKRVRP